VKRLLQNPIVRYLLAGGSAFALEYASFFAMYSIAGWKLLVANSISFGIGLLTSFTINRLWTFKSDTHRSTAKRQLIMYGTLALINLVLLNVAVELLHRAGIDPRIGKLVVMCAIPVWNYIIFKRYIFASHSSESD
jgi:putative flippase GtrA